MSQTPPEQDWALPETRALLEDARRLSAWPPVAEARLRQRIASDASKQQRRTWPAYALAIGTAAAAAVVLCVWLLRPPPAPPAMHALALDSDVQLLTSQEAALDVLTPSRQEGASGVTRQVVLLAGWLQAKVDKQAPGNRFAVLTPHLRVLVVGTRFTVEVGEEHTVVSVAMGRVRVESARGQAIELAAGQTARSDDPRLVGSSVAPPPTPSVAPPAFSTCDALSGESERIACYSRFAQGSGLAAENALFLLGLSAEKQGDVDGALAHWNELARRFPDGALAPETELSSLRAMVHLHHFDQALATARDFRARYASEARLPEVLLIQAKLLCSHRRELAPALQAFEAVQRSQASTEVRQEALFAAASCQLSLGHRSAGEEALRRYLEQYPDAAHSDDARRLLDGPQ